MPRIVKQVAVNIPVTVYDESMFDIETSQDEFQDQKMEPQEQEVVKADVKALTDIIIKNAQDKAQEIIHTAKLEAQTMITQMKSDFEKLSEIKMQAAMEEGYEKGILQGEKDGYEKGNLQALKENEIVNANLQLQVQQNIENALEQINKYKLKLDKTNEKSVIQLTSAISKKIINKKIADNDELILELIKNAVQDSKQSATIKLKIGSFYFETANKYQTEIAEIFKDYTNNFSIEQLEHIEQDKCLIELDNTIIDATANVQVQNAIKVINSQL